MKVRSFFGRDIDPDLQLALLGFINKVMDLLVTVSLENLGSLLITLWMIGRDPFPGKSGARITDLTLIQEFTKPWVSVASYWRRCRTFGWKGTGWSGLGRFLSTFVVAICVLLQAVAINTLGMPKQRWLAEGSVAHPSLQFHGMDLSFWQAGFDTVGGGAKSWDAAAMVSTALVFDSLRVLPAEFGNEKRGWHQIGGNSKDAGQSAIDTRLRNNTAVAMSLQIAPTEWIFSWCQQNGSETARNAIGWNVDLSSVVPSISVTCEEAENRTIHGSVEVSSANQSTSFSLYAGPPVSVNASAANCTITFHQSRYPINIWKIDRGDTVISVDAWGQDAQRELHTLPVQNVDNSIAQSLSGQVSVVITALERFVPKLTATDLLHSNAQRIRDFSDGRNFSVSPLLALAAVVAMIPATIMGHSIWNTTLNQDELVESTNVKWQIFGAGPRLEWEWVTVVVVSVLVSTLLYSMCLSLCYRVSPSEMLKPGGMLVAANLSDNLYLLKSASPTESVVQGTSVCIRHADDGTDRITFCEDALNKKKLDFGLIHRWHN